MGCIADLDIIEFCAQECERQHSGELSVYDMIQAWYFAQDYYEATTNPDPLTPDLIEEIGQIVEPVDNKYGFRRVPVYVTKGPWEYVEKAPWERVPYLLEALLESYYDNPLFGRDTDMKRHSLATSAVSQFYYEFEEIHPFVDGNGRVGKILFNYLNGTLHRPVITPNFWGISNP